MKTEQEANQVRYVAPEIKTLSEAEMLELMGPAQAYTGTVPFGF